MTEPTPDNSPADGSPPDAPDDAGDNALTPSANPFQVPLHAITADAERDSFTKRWHFLTAAVGTLSRAVAWSLLLLISLYYAPDALKKLAGETTTASKGTLAAIAWLERMAARQHSLWICWSVMLAFDFFIRYSEPGKFGKSKRRPWRLWAWNFFTFWSVMPLAFVFFVVLFMKLV